MNAPTIYSRLKAVAKPHLQHYVTDLTVHDRAICRVLQPGDTAIYAVRDSGTHFATFINSEDVGPAAAAKTAQRALDYVDAVLATSHDVRWYLVECTSPQRGSVSPVAFPEARFTIMSARDRFLVASRRQVAA